MFSLDVTAEVTATVPGAPEQVSGIVVFSEERTRGALADTSIGLQGSQIVDGCVAQLTQPGYLGSHDG